MCLYPRLIQNPKYRANKKNKGNTPKAIDNRVKAVPIGCGNCMECRKKKSRDWQVRLHEEIRDNKTGKFVTLTFSDEALNELQGEIKHKYGYELENATAKLGVRRFLERWRKKNGKSVRHWLITELGHNNTERIHIHGLIWTNKANEIEERWQYGNVWIGDYVNEKTINYIVKYVNKVDQKHKTYKSQIMTSAGIGSGYLNRLDSKSNKYKKGKTKETYTTRQGQKIALPIYYRNKIYNETEREKLWIEKLDKEERWINGAKIDISKGIEGYNKRLKEEQKRNIKLGYGDNKKDWSQQKYDEEMRMVFKKAREQKIWSSKKIKKT